MDYDYKQLHYNEELAQYPWVVKGYKSDGYPSSSVCAGMTRIQFLDSYESERDAVEAHPELLNNDEINWLNNYHSKVFLNLKKYMNKNELIDLKNSCSNI